MHTTEEDDEEIHRENDKSDSDFSDDDDSTYAPSTLETQYSDNEAMIQSLYSTDSGSESEEEENNPSNVFPTTSHDSSTTDECAIQKLLFWTWKNLHKHHATSSKSQSPFFQV